MPTTKRYSTKKTAPKQFSILYNINKTTAKEYLRRGLEINKWDLNATAEWLSMSLPTLDRYMTMTGLKSPVKNMSRKELESRVRYLEKQLAR